MTTITRSWKGSQVLSGSILIPYKVLITNSKILTIEKSSFLQSTSCQLPANSSLQPASCNQFVSISSFQSVTSNQFLATVIVDVYKQLPLAISTQFLQPISCDIFLSNKRLNFETPSSWVFQSEFLKKISYLEIKPLCICTSQKTQKSKFQKKSLLS